MSIKVNINIVRVVLIVLIFNCCNFLLAFDKSEFSLYKRKDFATKDIKDTDNNKDSEKRVKTGTVKTDTEDTKPSNWEPLPRELKEMILKNVFDSSVYNDKKDNKTALTKLAKLAALSTIDKESNWLINAPGFKLLDSQEVLNELIADPGLFTLKNIKLLVKFGADPDFKNRFGMTLLMRASATKQLEIVKYLLSLNSLFNGSENNKVDVNMRDDMGNTPLHWAVHVPNNSEIIRLLVDNGANLNVQNSAGFTPLQWAKFQTSDNNAETLLELGAVSLETE